MPKKKYIKIDDVIYIDELIQKMSEIKVLYGNLPICIKFKSEFEDFDGNEILLLSQINIGKIDQCKISYSLINGKTALILG